MEMKREPKIDFKISFEGGEYVFSVPHGANLEEVKKAAFAFAGAFKSALDQFNEQEKQKQDSKEEEKEEVVEPEPSVSS